MLRRELFNMYDEDSDSNDDEEDSIDTRPSSSSPSSSVLSLPILGKQAKQSPPLDPHDKPKPRRTLIKGLNMHRDYGIYTWTPANGIRELIQNLWDGTMETYKLTPSGIDVVEWTTEKLEIVTFNLYPASFLENKRQKTKNDGVLSQIKYHPKANRLELINFKVKLNHEILTIGKTSKRSHSSVQRHLIGGHGEGLKIGINALLRDGHSVTYYTNDERWQFLYDGKTPATKVLAVRIKKAGRPKGKPKNQADVNTTVHVHSLAKDTVDFGHYLFLRPPSETLAPSDPTKRLSTGYICLEEKYRHQIYVKGMFVREFPRTSEGKLALGYDLLGPISLNRDRNFSQSEESLCKEIWGVWKALLLDDKVSETAVKHYTHLFEYDRRCLDIKHAPKLIEEDPECDEIARILFRYFKKREEDRLGGTRKVWLYSDTAEGGQSVPIIHELNMVPVKVPSELFEMWEAGNAVRSIEEQRRRVLLRCEDSTRVQESRFSCHTKRLLDLFQVIPKDHEYRWKNAEKIDLDVVTDRKIIYINDRNFSIDFVHDGGATTLCPAYSSLPQPVDNTPPDYSRFVCDCSAHALGSQIFDALRYFSSPKVRRESENSRRNLAMLYPRSLAANSSTPSNSPLLTLTWTTLAGADSRDFLVMVRPGKLTLDRNLHDPSLVTLPTAVFEDESESESESVASREMLFRTAEANLVLENLTPGMWYTAQVCADRPKIATAFSEPLVFSCPLPPVRDVKIEYAGQNTLVVTFAAVENASSYMVKLLHEDSTTSTYTTEALHWTNVVRPDDISVEIVAWSVEAVSSYGSTTYPIEFPLPVLPRIPEERSRSNSYMSVEDILGDSEDLTPKSKLGQFLKPLTIDGYLSDSSMEPDSGVPNFDDSDDSDDENENDGDGDGEDTRIDDDEDDDDEEDVGDEWDDVPTETAAKLEKNALLLNSVDMIEIGGRQLKKGRAYEVIKRGKLDPSTDTESQDHLIINVQDIFENKESAVPHQGERRPKPFLLVHIYRSEFDWLSSGRTELHTPIADLQGRRPVLLMSFDDSANQVIHIDDIVEVLHPITIILPGQPSNDGSRPQVSCDFVCYISRKSALKEEEYYPISTFYNYAEAPERSKPPSPDGIRVADFFCGAGGFSAGATEAGLDVAVGVDKDRFAATTWKLNHPSGEEHQVDVHTFLTELELGHVKVPGEPINTVLISPPCEPFSKASNGGQDDDVNRRLLHSVVDIARVIQPYWVCMENVANLRSITHRSDLRRVIKGLLELGYQVRIATLLAADYGVPQERRRVILIAAKSGLQLPPFPVATHTKSKGINPDLKPYVTVREAIEDLNYQNPRADSSRDNPKYRRPTRNVSSYAQNLIGPSTEVLYHTTGNRSHSNKLAIWRSPSWDQPSATILTAPSERWHSVHPDKQRLMTPREVARLQSFPDSWQFCGAVQKQYKQIGNAVPPLLAKALAASIRKYAEEDFPSLSRRSSTPAEHAAEGMIFYSGRKRSLDDVSDEEEAVQLKRARKTM